MSSHPNIVFIMTDQQRYDMLGCVSGGRFQTPNLDRLAASGVRFANAFTTTPLCTPARAALFTGMYSSSSGAVANQIPLFYGVRNMGQIFREAGYSTGYIGKWHLDNTLDYYGAGKAPDGFPQEWWYDGYQFRKDIGDAGFNKWMMGENLDEGDCWAARLADRAEKFIQQYSKKRKPFYLVASFDEPHGTCSAPQRYYDLYRGTKRPRAPNFDDTLDDKPALHRALEKEFFKGNARVPHGEDPNNNPPYYGCNTFADAQIGRVLDAIDTYCAKNTIVVFTSDHGDHAGAHKLLAKGPTMYEEITRVPMILRVPGIIKKGVVCEQLISHIDLAPTLCSLAGISIPENFEGVNARSLLDSPSSPIQNEIYMEFYRFGLPHHTRWGFTPIKCIRTLKYKLALNMLDRDEFYDLEKDPWEMKNFIDNPQYADIRNELHDKILDWMDKRLDPLRGNVWWQRPWRKNKIMPADYSPVETHQRRRD